MAQRGCPNIFGFLGEKLQKNKNVILLLKYIWIVGILLKNPKILGPTNKFV